MSKPRTRDYHTLENFPLEAVAKYGPWSVVIQVEEGIIYRFQPPLANGADIGKFWYTNYHFVLDHKDNTVVRFPKFSLAPYPEMFLRNFHLYKIANLLFPNNVIDVVASDVPASTPFYFDCLNPPTDSDGKPTFPAFFSREVIPASPDHIESLRPVYERIFGDKRNLFDIIEQGGSEEEIARALETHKHNIDEYDARIRKELGPQIQDLKGTLANSGLGLQHPEINYIMDENGNLVFIEIDISFCLDYLESAIYGLPGKIVEEADQHLNEALRLTIEAGKKAQRDPQYIWDVNTLIKDTDDYPLSVEELEERLETRIDQF